MTRSFRIRRRHKKLWRRLVGGLCAVTFLALMIACCGCRQAHATEHRLTGHAGQLVFTYDSQWDVRNFNKPLLVGSELDLYILAMGKTFESAKVLHAQSLTPHTLSVSAISKNRVRIKALTKGLAMLHVLASDHQGTPREDTISLRIDSPTEIFYFPERSSELRKPSSYRHHHVSFHVGSRVEIPWIRYSSKDESLIGFGQSPVRIRPRWTGRIDPTHQHSDTLKLIMPDVPTIFEVLPAEGVLGEHLIVEVLPHRRTKGLNVK